MKSLMKSNIYDVNETVVIVGSCLKDMQPQGFRKLEEISKNIFDVCLEETHINMAITKIAGMIRTKNIKKIIFATVDKSPHCIQLHFVQNELQKIMDLSDVEVENYVVLDNKLTKISPKAISLSKNLKAISDLLSKK